MYDYVSNKEDPEKEFDLIERINKENYRNIYKAKHKRTRKIVIVEIINISNGIEKYKKEITIISQFHSQFILSYYGSYAKNSSIWIIYEYCEGGSLLELISLLDKELDEEQIASFVYMILQGLSYMHDNKKIYLNITPGNIFITYDGIAKLSYFAISNQLMYTMPKKISKSDFQFYMSPEVIMQNKYNCKSDIWSLGIICIEMAEKVIPISNIKSSLLVKKITTQPQIGLKNKVKWSKEFNDFVSKCLIYDPNQRPSAKALLNHLFITKNKKGNKLISELIKNTYNNLALYEDKAFDKYKKKEEECIDFIYNNNNQSENVDDNELSCSIIIKEGYNNEIENILEESMNKLENPFNKSNDSPHMTLRNMNNKNTTDDIGRTTIRAKETKLKEEYEKIVNKDKNMIYSISNDIEDIINDSSINNLTLQQIQDEIGKIEIKMNEEIQKVKDKYNKKINDYKQSLQLFERNNLINK